MRIVFLSRWYPYPPDNGSKIRVYNILKQLSLDHDLALLTFAGSGDQVNASTMAALRTYCSRLRVVPYRAFDPYSPKAILGFLSPRPRLLVDTLSEGMATAVSEELEERKCDLIVASQLDMVPYAVATRGVPALLEELEITVYSDELNANKGLASRLRPLLTWLKLISYLRRVLPRFSACTVASEVEKATLLRVVPSFTKVEVIPNAVEVSHYDGQFGPPVPNTIVSCGALTYGPNYDAVRYFLENVFPLVKRAVPEALFRVTGDNKGVDLSSLPSHPAVCYTGYVHDIRSVVAQSWMSVVPLRGGGGTRLKILESMALGTPVVSSSKGAEGLEVTDGENILIADDPRQFADKVSSLLQSPELRRRLGANGRRLVESKYDWRIVGLQLRRLVDRVGAEQSVQCHVH